MIKKITFVVMGAIVAIALVHGINFSKSEDFSFQSIQGLQLASATGEYCATYMAEAVFCPSTCNYGTNCVQAGCGCTTDSCQSA